MTCGVAAAHIITANALKLTTDREPLLSFEPTPEKAPYKMNYFVPNFGLDHEVLGEKENLKVAEAQLKHKFFLDTDPPKGPPKDYFVPNFGMDEDIAASLKHLNQQESIHGKWELPESMVQLDSNVQADREPLMAKVGVPKKSVGGHPTNYFVPDFGMDEDIITTQANIKAQKEKAGLKWPGDSFVQTNAEMGREPLLTWAPTIADPDHPMNYFVPNFGLDHDILGADANLKLTEERLGHKLHIETDPPKGPPKDYFVPNFGMDFDIKSSLSNLKEAEGIHGKMSLSQYGAYGTAPEGAMPFNFDHVQLEDNVDKKERKMVKDQTKIDEKLKKI
jgi:hypothetical protein